MHLCLDQEVCKDAGLETKYEAAIVPATGAALLGINRPLLTVVAADQRERFYTLIIIVLEKL
jgi:predicted cation transporter